MLHFSFSEIRHSLSHLMFPHLCDGCSSPLIQQERVLCMNCLQELPLTQFHHLPENDAAIRIAGRIPFQHATAFGYFSTEGLLQHLLHRLKYSGRKDIGVFLGKQAAYSLQDASWIQQIDAIIPVPLHPQKKAARGFNQTAIVGAALAAELNLRMHENALIRNRKTQSQTNKTREERVLNVKNAFSVSSKNKPAAGHYLLIDDVLTTGATLEAAAAPLLGIPGLKLSIMTVGIAMI